MITDLELDDIVSPDIDALWFKHAEKVKSFLLDEFCNNRNRLHLKTAGFWKFLIREILAADEPAKYVAPLNEWNFDVYSHLVLAAGGYCRIETLPVTKRVAAEMFGLPKNAAKQHLHRLRRRSEAFFKRGGQYIPAAKNKPESRADKVTDPLEYKLDRPVYAGRRQWKTPTYKMVQKSPELSSLIAVSSRDADGFYTESEIDVLDELIPYDYSRLRGHVSRLPCPSPVSGGRWEYPSLEDEFWSFMREYEAEYAYRGALQNCLAKMAYEKYHKQCDANREHNPSHLEGRAVLSTCDDQRTKSATRATMVDDFIIKDNFNAEEKAEPSSRGFAITLRRHGTDWKIEHSKFGSGTVLKVTGNVVCCKFTEGRANLTVDAIKRKTGINLKKKIELHQALQRLTAQRAASFLAHRSV